MAAGGGGATDRSSVLPPPQDAVPEATAFDKPLWRECRRNTLCMIIGKTYSRLNPMQVATINCHLPIVMIHNFPARDAPPVRPRSKVLYGPDLNI